MYLSIKSNTARTSKNAPVTLVIASPEKGLKIKITPKIVISIPITKVPIHVLSKPFKVNAHFTFAKPDIVKLIPIPIAIALTTEPG